MATGSFLVAGNILILAVFILLFWNNLADPIWIVYWIITSVIYSFVVWGFFGTIELHRRVKNAWSQIDVQLQKRNDLVPNLVETVKGYMKHERAIMDNVSKARAEMLQARSPGEASKASGLLSSVLGSLFAIAENYPQLKANENFKLLQEQLEGVENNIAFSRQFYNDSVMRYDTSISSSHSIFAKILGYRRDEFQYFEAPKEAMGVPKVKF